MITYEYTTVSSPEIRPIFTLQGFTKGLGLISPPAAHNGRFTAVRLGSPAPELRRANSQCQRMGPRMVYN